MQEIDDFIDRAEHLPAAPKVLPQLMSLLNDINADITEIEQMIGLDPALTASVIRVCNSAFFAGSEPVGDLSEAVGRLGYQQVLRIVASLRVGKMLSGDQKGYGLDEGELWKHSVTTGLAAQLIARDTGDNESVAFTAGLLHDVGKIVMAEVLEHIYGKLIEDVEKNQQSLLEAEKRLLGVHHAEVGGRLLARWKFPEGLVAAVWHHHQPSLAEGQERLASLVYLGNMIAYFIGQGFGHQAFALRGRTEALELLNLKGDALPYYMIKTYESLEEIEVFLQLRS